MFVSKPVEDTEHYHGGQGLTRLSEQSIGAEHHRREGRTARERRKGYVLKDSRLLQPVFTFTLYLRLYFSRSASMMSARGKPKRLKDAWIKILHTTRDVQSELHGINEEPDKLLDHVHGKGEEKGQNIVVLGTEDQHQGGQSGLQAEGVEDDPVVADVVEEALTAEHQQLEDGRTVGTEQ